MTKKLIAILLFASGTAWAADAPFSSLTALTALAGGDLFAVTDISDTTQSANGSTRKITADNVGLFYISDTAYSSAFNGVTTVAPSKNTMYDYLHIGDADDDGKIDVIDSAAAGFFVNNSSGAFVASRTLAEDGAKPGIDITNPTGAAADPAFGLDLTEVVGNQTWADGTNASILWTFNLSGTDPVITFSSGVVNVSTGTLQQGGVDVVTSSGTVAFTNKTLDGSATGNVLKFKSLPQFTSPLRVDGTNCTIGTTSTALGYGLATYTGSSVAASANWAEFRILVPNDFDTAVGFEPRVRIADLNGGDTNTRRYVVTLTNVANSASASPSPSATVTNVDIVDASGASGDVNISSYTSCAAGTAAALTAGNLLVVRVARDGSSGTDTSTVASTLISMELEYGASQ